MLNVVSLTGENCGSRKESQRNRQSVGKDKGGEVPRSRGREGVQRERGPEREKGSDSGDEEKGKGRREKEKRAGGVKVSEGLVYFRVKLLEQSVYPKANCLY